MLRCSLDFWYLYWFLRYLEKKLRPLFLPKNRTQARFFWLFEQTTELILITNLGKIEYDVPNKKPRWFGPISLKVKKLYEDQGQIRSKTFIYLYLWNLSVMSSCYSDFWYLGCFWVMAEKSKPYDGISRVFGCFSILLPPQTEIQTSVSIESECLRFQRFRGNLVDIGLVDSKKLGWKNI